MPSIIKRYTLAKKKSKAGLDQVLENYFAEYFKLKSNNKFLKINYLGFEEDKESINVYLESEATEMPKK